MSQRLGRHIKTGCLIALSALTLKGETLANFHHHGGGYHGSYGGGRPGPHYHPGPVYRGGTTVLLGAPVFATLPLLVAPPPPQPVIIQSQPVIIQQAPQPQPGAQPLAATTLPPPASLPTPPKAPSTTALPEDVILGIPGAPVEVIVYTGFTNNASAHFYFNALPQLRKEFVDSGRIRLILRDLPLDQVSSTASMIARDGKGKGSEHYLKCAEVFYKNQPTLLAHRDPLSFVKALAGQAGVPKKEISKAVSNGLLASKLHNGVEEAKNRYKIQATPMIIPLGKQVISYAPDYAQLKAAIEAALQ